MDNTSLTIQHHSLHLIIVNFKGNSHFNCFLLECFETLSDLKGDSFILNQISFQHTHCRTCIQSILSLRSHQTILQLIQLNYYQDELKSTLKQAGLF